MHRTKKAGTPSLSPMTPPHGRLPLPLLIPVPPPAVEEDDWTPAVKRGTSGRGGRNYNQRSVNPVPVGRNEGPTRGGAPATSTNRTTLGAPGRYRQLTFEETARRARTHNEGGDVPSVQPDNSRAGPLYVPNASNDRDGYGSWFDDIPPDMQLRSHAANSGPHSQHNPPTFPSQCQ